MGREEMETIYVDNNFEKFRHELAKEDMQGLGEEGGFHVTRIVFNILSWSY